MVLGARPGLWFWKRVTSIESAFRIIESLMLRAKPRRNWDHCLPMCSRMNWFMLFDLGNNYSAWICHTSFDRMKKKGSKRLREPYSQKPVILRLPASYRADSPVHTNRSAAALDSVKPIYSNPGAQANTACAQPDDAASTFASLHVDDEQARGGPVRDNAPACAPA